jgi:hypothetical protein
LGGPLRTTRGGRFFFERQPDVHLRHLAKKVSTCVISMFLSKGSSKTRGKKMSAFPKQTLGKHFFWGFFSRRSFSFLPIKFFDCLLRLLSASRYPARGDSELLKGDCKLQSFYFSLFTFHEVFFCRPLGLEGAPVAVTAS